MAYVQFWKGLAANYNATDHAEGIYQCTDTGDTYIFGVKNSGAGGEMSDGKYVTYYKEDPEELSPLAKTSYRTGSYTEQEFNNAKQYIINQGYYQGDYYNLLYNLLTDGALVTRALFPYNWVSWRYDESDQRIILREFYLENTVPGFSLRMRRYESSGLVDDVQEVFDLDLNQVGNKLTINREVYEDSNEIKFSIDLDKSGDGTKFLSDDGTYKTSEFMGRPYKMTVNCTNGAFAGVMLNDNYCNYVVLLDDFNEAQDNRIAFQGSLSDGCECTAILKNNGTESIPVTILSGSLAGTLVNLTGDVEIPAGKIAELNLLRVGNTYYLRSAVQS